MTERFLKLKEVQVMLGVSRSTVWRWHAERGLKVVRVGDVVRIRESDLQAFLKRHETASVIPERNTGRELSKTLQINSGLDTTNGL
jgi:excisionase family DNA binding protein